MSTLHLNRNSVQYQQALNRVSSGSRISKASDDAAGLAVSNSIRADVGAYKRAAINTQQAQALLKVADGGLEAIGNVLNRMLSIAAQARSGAVDATARGFLNTEFIALRTEANNIANNTRFNNFRLIDGSYNAARGTFLVGSDVADTIVADMSVFDANTNALGVSTSTVTTSANASTAFTRVNTAIDRISTARATVGSLMSRFEYRGMFVDRAVESNVAAVSAITDADLAADQVAISGMQVLTEASVAALSQANNMKSSLLNLVKGNS